MSTVPPPLPNEVAEMKTGKDLKRLSPQGRIFRTIGSQAGERGQDSAPAASVSNAETPMPNSRNRKRVH